MSRKVKRIALGVGVALLAIGGAGFGVYSWLTAEEPDLPVSAESGRAYFRHRDFGSPYQTGLPYALALAAMDRYPEELGRDRPAFCEKFGTLVDPADPEGLPVGFVRHHDRLSGTDFLMTNCSLCHTGVVDGKPVPGLGNRNLRLNAMNHAVMRIAARSDFNADSMMETCRKVAKDHAIPWGKRAEFVTGEAIRSLKAMAGKPTADAWGGLSNVDAGPGRNTPIEFAKEVSGVPIGPPYGLVKLPAVWTHPHRATFGVDGSLTGDMAIALAAVEFNKHMPARDILRREPRWRSVHEYLKTLRAPAYPRPVDATEAARGKAIFTENCGRCHGSYGADGSVKYKEKVVALDVIGTDPDRVRSVTDALVEVRSRGDFAKFVRLEKTSGYVPPVLSGLWCRGPYLHNGSVPTLADLLRPAEERPAKFFVGGDTGYDLDRVGLLYEEEARPGPDNPSTGKGIAPGTVVPRAGKRASPRQFPFDTSAPGNRNAGHEFGSELPEADKKSLLEYLKTL